MNKKEREQIDLNVYSRCLDYIRKCLYNTKFVEILDEEKLEELYENHKKQCAMFEKYIEALRYDAKGDKQKVWRLKQEKELAEKNEKHFEKLYQELYKEKESDIETKWEKICNTRIERYIEQNELTFNDRVKFVTREIEKELEKQKSINEKWKAMFTEQAMANAKLINKEEN